MKTTSRKSWAVNPFQVSKLTFDPCFKVHLCHCTKKSLYIPYNVLLLPLGILDGFLVTFKKNKMAIILFVREIALSNVK